MERIDEVQVCLGQMLVWTCWALGWVLILADISGATHRPVGEAGVALIGFGIYFGVMAQIRHLHDRERAVFDLGQESVRHLH